IENDGSHPDQTVCTDLTAVEDGAMPDGASHTDGQRMAHVGVKDAMFLNVCFPTDHDRLIVTAQDAAEPHTHGLAEHDLPYNHRVRGNPEVVIGWHLRSNPVKGVEAHPFPRRRCSDPVWRPSLGLP